MTSAADELDWLSSALLADVPGGVCVAAPSIEPQIDFAKAVGRAYTFAFEAGDNLAFHVAVADARPGDLLVGVCGARVEVGVFGDLLATAAWHAGLAGLVTDGLIRDRADLAALGFAVFAAGRAPSKAAKDHAGRHGVPVPLGSHTVAPGDLICADDDGIVVVPADRIHATLAAARALHSKESTVRGRLREGETTISALGLDVDRNER